ncbi:MAG: amidohydrolase [Bacillota bacterium]
MERKESVREALNGLKPRLTELNQWMYDNPELGFQEYRASELLTEELQSAGFEVQRGIAGKETAFMAKYESSGDGPAIAFFAEYDALPDIGHACGHNIIATSAIGAAISLIKAWPGLPGSVYVFGAPAEEQSSVIDDCGGKVYIVEEDLLENVDVAMMMHPTNFNSAWSNNLAVQPLEMVFYGKTAQPAGSAHLGINAFEAAVLAYTNINAIRQYFPPDHFVHGMTTESGPAPNIMSPRSKLRLHVRAPTNAELEELLVRIKHCGQAAALVTGARVDFNYYLLRYLEMVNNHVLGNLLEKNLRELDLEVSPRAARPRGSTDMGNVSQTVPSVHGYISLGPAEEVGNTHNPEFAPSTIKEPGRQALLNAASAMAMTAVELLENPTLVEEAKNEFEETMKQRA